jgi:hypothetical protein
VAQRADQPSGQHVEDTDELDVGDIPLDPHAIERNYRLERARRRARVRHKQEHTLAGVRFYAVLGVLVAIALSLLVLIWDEVGRLFGL